MTDNKRYEELRDKILYGIDGLTPEEHEEFETLNNARKLQHSFIKKVGR